jgi:hypothetical protein
MHVHVLPYPVSQVIMDTWDASLAFNSTTLLWQHPRFC